VTCLVNTKTHSNIPLYIFIGTGGIRDPEPLHLEYVTKPKMESSAEACTVVLCRRGVQQQKLFHSMLSIALTIRPITTPYLLY
jgi:hypothetical protein